MDLGATICTPRTPRCMVCPLAGQCRGLEEGIAGRLPAKSPKPERPLRHGVSYWLVAEDGSVLLRRRPEAGLLGGMAEIPTSDFRDRPWDLADAVAAAPVAAGWRPVAGTVVHGFTHFGLELRLLAARTGAPDPALGTWSAVARLGEHALPTLMKKVVRHAIAAEAGPMAAPAAAAPAAAANRRASAVPAPAARPHSARRG
jgi:A/G-specific adenine glycosylase